MGVQITNDLDFNNGSLKIGDLTQPFSAYENTFRSYDLQNYSWPGNLRQLKNTIKRATLLAKGDFITLRDLGEEFAEPVPEVRTFFLHDEETEKQRILDALQQTKNNKTKAAQLLGVDRKTLYNKLKLYNIPQ